MHIQKLSPSQKCKTHVPWRKVQSSRTRKTDRFYRVSYFFTPFNQKGIHEWEYKKSDSFLNYHLFPLFNALVIHHRHNTAFLCTPPPSDTGFIDRDELRCLVKTGMEESSVRLSEVKMDHLTDTLFTSADKDNSGTISFDEFMGSLRRYPDMIDNFSIGCVYIFIICLFIYLYLACHFLAVKNTGLKLWWF